MILTPQPSPPVVPIIVTLGPLDPDNDMCTQLADKVANNTIHNDSIISLDLRSWHSGPSDKHLAQQVAKKSNSTNRDTRHYA